MIFVHWNSYSFSFVSLNHQNEDMFFLVFAEHTNLELTMATRGDLMTLLLFIIIVITVIMIWISVYISRSINCQFNLAMLTVTLTKTFLMGKWKEV